MVRWEYQTVYAESYGTGAKEARLRELGEAGWEVFALGRTVVSLNRAKDLGLYGDRPRWDHREAYQLGQYGLGPTVEVWQFECKRPKEAA
jgi:hypothetical protein